MSHDTPRWLTRHEISDGCLACDQSNCLSPTHRGARDPSRAFKNVPRSRGPADISWNHVSSKGSQQLQQRGRNSTRAVLKDSTLRSRSLPLSMTFLNRTQEPWAQHTRSLPPPAWLRHTSRGHRMQETCARRTASPPSQPSSPTGSFGEEVRRIRHSSAQRPAHHPTVFGQR